MTPIDYVFWTTAGLILLGVLYLIFVPYEQWSAEKYPEFGRKMKPLFDGIALGAGVLMFVAIIIITTLVFGIVTAEAQLKKRVVRENIVSPADASYTTNEKLQCPPVPVGKSRIYQAELYFLSGEQNLKLLPDGPPTPPDGQQQCRFHVTLTCELCAFEQYAQVRTGDAPASEFLTGVTGQGLSVVNISCVIPSSLAPEPFIIYWGQIFPDPMERVELLTGSWLECHDF